MSAIVAEGLQAGYGEALVLNGVDATVAAGAITCVIGGSGCGKSTFLRSAVGMLAPAGGAVRVLGEDVYALDGEARSAHMARLGLMFQYGALLGSLSLDENLALPVRAHTDLPETVVDALVQLKLDLVGLHAARHRLPGQLSGGMRKRAGLARALMLDPELLICDEPNAGLDPNTAAQIDQLLLRLQRMFRMTVVVVTHELHSIRTIADRIILLDAGRCCFSGTLAEAQASDDPRLIRFFDPKGEARHGGRTYREVLL